MVCGRTSYCCVPERVGVKGRGLPKLLELRRDKRCAATSPASAMPNEMTEKSVMLVVRVPGLD